MSSNANNRRSSGRARKPTAKLEALAGTRFNSADPDPGRISHPSQSPAPSHTSAISTSISPQPNSVLRSKETPSTTSTNPSLELSIEGDAPSTQTTFDNSPIDSVKRESRRARKPTQRALEATETMPTTRRQRQTKHDRGSTEFRFSAAPSDTSTTPETSQQTDAALEHLRVSTRRGQKSKAHTASTDHHDELAVDDQMENDSEPNKVDPSSASTDATATASPSKPRLRQRSSIKEASHTNAQESQLDHRVTRTTRSRISAVKSEHIEEPPVLIPGLATNTELSTSKPESKSTVETGSAAEDTEAIAPASKRSRRSQRASAVMPEAGPSPAQTDSSKQKQVSEQPTQARPRRSTNKPTSYAASDVEESEDTVDMVHPDSVGHEPSSVTESPKSKSKPKSSSSQKTSDHMSSPSPVGTPKKSLKLTFRSPRLKGPHLPSKLRYSIQSHEVADASPAPSEKTVEKAITTKEPSARAKGKQKARSNFIATPVPPTDTQPQKATRPTVKVAPKSTLPAEKLSRRAQAKADAKAMVKVRQAAVPLTQTLHQAPEYVASASHYVPSARLISPAMGCNLFCLDPPSRILAFAQIAAESNDSDEEESSQDGQPPRIYEKWLEKGRDRFCVCDKPSHAHNHQAQADTTMDGPQQDALNSETQMEPVVNQDLAAAIPHNTTLPISVPPVNSIMRKSQGRRVSALYNVMAGSSSSGGSNRGSHSSLSHSHSSLDYSPGPNLVSPSGTSAGPIVHPPQAPFGSVSREDSTSGPQDSLVRSDSFSSAPSQHPQQAASSMSNGHAHAHGERQRWHQQMLTRIRKEAKEAGIIATPNMTYNEIKAKLEADKRSHTSPDHSSESEHIHPPTHPGSADLSSDDYIIDLHEDPRVNFISSAATSNSGGGVQGTQDLSSDDYIIDLHDDHFPINGASSATTYNSGAGVRPPQGYLRSPAPMEDEDDPLMRIIDDSVRVTRERNAARAASSVIDATKPMHNIEGENVGTGEGPQNGTSVKRKRGLAGGSEGKSKRQRVFADGRTSWAEMIASYKRDP